MRPSALEYIESKQLRKDVTDFRTGDTVRVHWKVKEGEKERVQPFEGVVIRKTQGANRATFTVRKMSYGVGGSTSASCGARRAGWTPRRSWSRGPLLPPRRPPSPPPRPRQPPPLQRARRARRARPARRPPPRRGSDLRARGLNAETAWIDAALACPRGRCRRRSSVT